MPKTIDDYLKELEGPDSKPQGLKTVADYLQEAEAERQAALGAIEKPNPLVPGLNPPALLSRDTVDAIGENVDQVGQYIRHPIDTAVELGKNLGASQIELPGIMTKAVGGAADALERYERAIGVRKNNDQSLPTLGNTIMDVGQEMIDRPRLDLGAIGRPDLGVDVGWTPELGLAPDPKRADETLMQAARSVNSMEAAMITPGGVIGKTLMGAALQSQGQADQAKKYILEHGGTEADANKEAAWQFVANLPAGALESVQWGLFMNRFGAKNFLEAAEKKWGATATRRLFRAVVEQGAVEGLEEVGQQLWGNLTARHYNPDQKLGEGVGQSFKVGALMGGAMAGAPQLGVELAKKYMGDDADFNDKTADQKLAAAKDKLKQAKKNDPENEKVIKDLTDLVHIAERVSNGQYKVDEASRIAQEKQKATEEAHAHEQAVKSNAEVDAQMTQFTDATDRPEQQLKILKLKDTSILDTIGKVQVYNQTAMLEAEAKRQKDIETAQKKAQQEKEAQLKAQQKTGTEAEKAVEKVSAHASPQKTGVDIGVDATDVIKEDPTKAAETLSGVTQTTLPKYDPLSARGVFDQIINAPDPLAGVQQNPGWKPLTQHVAPVQQAPAAAQVQPLAPIQQAPAASQVQPSAPVQLTDLEQYDAVQAQMAAIGHQNANTPEYQALWQASEEIKNRNGGMPPGQVSPPIQQDQIVESRVEPAAVEAGVWDGRDIGDAPVTALRMEDGTILIDPSAKVHGQAFINLGVDPTKVKDGGFVRGKKYSQSGADTKRIVRQAKARKSLEETPLFPQPIETTAPVAAPAVLGDQEVTIQRFNDQGDFVEDTMTAADAKKWADGKLDTLNKLLECLAK